MREQIFEVGHKSLVKEKLVALLTSELVPVSLMHHDGHSESSSVEDEGIFFIILHRVSFSKNLPVPHHYFQWHVMWGIGWRSPVIIHQEFVQKAALAS